MDPQGPASDSESEYEWVMEGGKRKRRRKQKSKRSKRRRSSEKRVAPFRQKQYDQRLMALNARIAQDNEDRLMRTIKESERKQDRGERRGTRLAGAISDVFKLPLVGPALKLLVLSGKLNEKQLADWVNRGVDYVVAKVTNYFKEHPDATVPGADTHNGVNQSEWMNERRNEHRRWFEWLGAKVGVNLDMDPEKLDKLVATEWELMVERGRKDDATLKKDKHYQDILNRLHQENDSMLAHLGTHVKYLEDQLETARGFEIPSTKQKARLEIDSIRSETDRILSEADAEAFEKLYVPLEAAKKDLSVKAKLIEALQGQLQQNAADDRIRTQLRQQIETLQREKEKVLRSKEHYESEVARLRPDVLAMYEQYNTLYAARNAAEEEQKEFQRALKQEAKANAVQIARDRDAARQAAEVARKAKEDAKKASDEANEVNLKLKNAQGYLDEVENLTKRIVERAEAQAAAKAREILDKANAEAEVARQRKESDFKFQQEAQVKLEADKAKMAQWELDKSFEYEKKRRAIEEAQMQATKKFEEERAAIAKLKKELDIKIEASRASGMGLTGDLAKDWNALERARLESLAEEKRVRKEFEAARAALPAELKAYEDALRKHLAESVMSARDADEAVEAASKEIDYVRAREGAVTQMLTRWKDMSLEEFLNGLRQQQQRAEQIHRQITREDYDKLVKLFKTGQFPPEAIPAMNALASHFRYTSEPGPRTDDPSLSKYHIEGYINMELNATAYEEWRKANENPNYRQGVADAPEPPPHVEPPNPNDTPPQEPIQPPTAPAADQQPAAPAQQPEAPAPAPAQGSAPPPAPTGPGVVPQPKGAAMGMDGQTRGGQAGATNASNIATVTLGETINGEPVYKGWEATIPSMPPLNPAAAGTATAALQTPASGAPGAETTQSGDQKKDVLAATDADKEEARKGFALYQNRLQDKKAWDDWLAANNTKWAIIGTLKQMLPQDAVLTTAATSDKFKAGNDLWKVANLSSENKDKFDTWYNALSEDERKAFDSQKGSQDLPTQANKPPAKAYSWWQPKLQRGMFGLYVPGGGQWATWTNDQVPNSVDPNSRWGMKPNGDQSEGSSATRDTWLKTVQTRYTTGTPFEEFPGAGTFNIPSAGIFKGADGKIGWFLGGNGDVYSKEQWASVPTEAKGAAIPGVTLDLQTYAAPGTTQKGKGQKRKMSEKPHELDENEIKHHMRAFERKGFRGVVAADEVHQMKPYAKGGAPVSFIMNTDKRSQGGRHWVAVHWQGPNLHYYDPFGKPPTADMKRRFTDLVASDGKNGTVQLKVNRVPNQRGNSVTCGLHSMRFLQDMHGGASFQQATNFNTKEGEAAARSLMKGKDLPQFEYI